MTSATINLKDGVMYRVKQMDEIAKLTGPMYWVRHEPPDGDGGLYLNDGPLVAWFTLTPYGWLHKASGRVHRDVDYLGYLIAKEQQAAVQPTTPRR